MAPPPHVDLVERTSETIIDFDNNAIQVPTAFLSRWQSQLILQKYGWVKDLVGNYIKIDLSRVVEEGMIPGGLVISQHCGFLAPQRVILCYQIYDNQFDMRRVIFILSVVYCDIRATMTQLTIDEKELMEKFINEGGRVKERRMTRREDGTYYFRKWSISSCLEINSYIIKDEDFFADYTEAHQKLFELGKR